MLPQEHIPWLITQPDTVLSARMPQSDRIGLKYLMPFHDFQQEMFQIDIKKILTPNLGKIQGTLFEEIRKNIDDEFGLELEPWHKVHLFKAMESVVFRSINRIVVGQALSSNEGYRRALSTLMELLGGSGLLVGQLMPPILKPVTGYLAAIPIHYYKHKVLSYLLPVIRGEINNYQRHRISEPNEPVSLLSWMVAASIEGSETRHLTPEALAMNILFLVSCLYSQISYRRFPDLRTSALGRHNRLLQSHGVEASCTNGLY